MEQVKNGQTKPCDEVIKPYVKVFTRLNFQTRL